MDRIVGTWTGLQRETGNGATRRGIIRGLAGAMAAGAGLAATVSDESLAKGRGNDRNRAAANRDRERGDQAVSAQGKRKGKKVTICYQNQTRMVKKKGYQNTFPGATMGACPPAPAPPVNASPPPPPPPQPVACTTFILSGGPNQTDAIIIDDDMDIYNMTTGKFILIDGDEKASTHSPIVFSGEIGHILRVRAWDSGGCRSLSPLWVHCLANGQKKQLFTGYNGGGCYFTSNMYLNMEFTIEL